VAKHEDCGIQTLNYNNKVPAHTWLCGQAQKSSSQLLCGMCAKTATQEVKTTPHII
jgi:hypothetical protein